VSFRHKVLNRALAGAVLLTLASAPGTAAELVGFASLPADTFAEGPPAGRDDGSGEPIEANARLGPFPGQPVQGFSAVQPAPDRPDSFWFLSDNGFGRKDNSADYLLRIYRARPRFATEAGGAGDVQIEGFVQLSDPAGKVPFEIVNEDTENRCLTGADFDIESFVFDGSGDIWVGDEFGPFVLHFDSAGRLLRAPIPTPGRHGMDLSDGGFVRSPDNAALAGGGEADLARSRGFEGMARYPRSGAVYLLLEGSVTGDPAGALRLYEFDTRRRSFRGLAGFYGLEQPGHAIGDLAAVGDGGLLVLERDNRQGDDAVFKKVFRVDASVRDRTGFFTKTEIADLLDVRDPHDLDGDGSRSFSFPFVTVENLLVVDDDTILVANDNNYPFSVGRGPGIDQTEIILLRLDESLTERNQTLPE